MKKHLFLTGLQGVGKSTLLADLILGFSGKIGGFQTIWQQNNLHLIPFGNEDFSAKNKVAGRFDCGRWCSPDQFNRLAKDLFATPCDLLVMDELGFFEGESRAFQQEVLAQLDGETPVLGVIKPRNLPFLNRVRWHPNVEIVWVTIENRNRLAYQLREELPWGKCINGNQK